jgi:hypothetical protein
LVVEGEELVVAAFASAVVDVLVQSAQLIEDEAEEDEVVMLSLVVAASTGNADVVVVAFQSAQLLEDEFIMLDDAVFASTGFENVELIIFVVSASTGFDDIEELQSAQLCVPAAIIELDDMEISAAATGAEGFIMPSPPAGLAVTVIVLWTTSVTVT